jgi:hypothetical protein
MNRIPPFLAAMAAVFALLPGSAEPAAPSVAGRWDVTVGAPGASYPSWFEITESEGKLAGRFVGRFGSARPIHHLEFADGRLAFSLPAQYERDPKELRFDGRLAGDRLAGRTNGERGAELTWEAVRAPSLKRPAAPTWAAPQPLLNGRDLAGWKPLGAGGRGRWEVKEGVLANATPGANLATTASFTDFKLHAEFRLPKESNSGVYLRGRYEVQIEDDFRKPPSSHGLGGIYGFLAPRANPGRGPGAWQTFDITLVGRTVTVALNGETVISAQEIPGITGGALDSDEGAPGPLYLQGDHGPVDFRNLVLTPAA